KADIEPENIRPRDSSLLGHYSLQAFLALCPIRHNPINECEKLRPVMRLRNMAELMRNDVVNGIYRRLDEAMIEQEPTGGRHRSPSLSQLTNNQSSRAK